MAEAERFDDVIRDLIDFTNGLVGAYMDALAGFAGHVARVERQVHRALRPTGGRLDASGTPVVVYASYEDPRKPQAIHSRIVRADTYIADNSPRGLNEQRQANAIVIFLFTYWETEIRPRLAAARGVEPNAIGSDVMGDLRIVRHAVLHARGRVASKEHHRMKVLGEIVRPGVPIALGSEEMHRIFILVKQDCARMMTEWLGAGEPPGGLAKVRDVAIQRLG